MTEKEFDKKWKGADTDKLSDEELLQLKQDCFAMYEQAGFLDTFDSPYDEQGEHNGMAFKVVRRATAEECDIEAMPLWLVEFENGDTAYCYPEEICKAEKNARKDSRKTNKNTLGEQKTEEETKDENRSARSTVTLEDILQRYFRCSKPFLKKPRKTHGGEYTEYFTRRGGKAYEQLVALIGDLSALGVLRSNRAGIIIQLDAIVRNEY